MRYFDGLQHFSPAEAAKALGLTLHQVYGLVRGGKVAVRWAHSTPYIPRAEIERVLSLLEADGEQRVARKLLHALQVKQRLIFSWKNGHGRE